ncbi:unnamed protein product [Durusdinium trenchii]|uniref:Uncharacterized protein n=1 Tax=Durusdinium trenchii TaxID=1381693 RepID=A0ABP0MMD1_9DINO
MAVTTKQRLSDMLDADLSKADVQDMEEEMISSKPSTFSDWLQAASIEEMKASLKSLLSVSNGQALEQMKAVLEEDRAHQDWVQNQEKVWKESHEMKAADAPVATSKKEEVEPLMDARDVQNQVITSYMDAPHYSYDDLYGYSLGFLQGQGLDAELMKNEELVLADWLDDNMVLLAKVMCSASLTAAHMLPDIKGKAKWRSLTDCEPITARDFAKHHYIKLSVFCLQTFHLVLVNCEILQWPCVAACLE